MIYPPRHFDENEWMVSGFLVLTTLISLRLPKRFPLSITLLLLLFNTTVSRLFDHILAGPAFKDMYDIMDLNKIEWFDLVTYLMYAPPGYIFVYLYDRWKLKGLQIPAYILGWSLLSTGIEWLLYRGHVFTYKVWSIEYSFAVYMVVQPFTLWMFHFLKNNHKTFEGRSTL